MFVPEAIHNINTVSKCSFLRKAKHDEVRDTTVFASTQPISTINLITLMWVW